MPATEPRTLNTEEQSDAMDLTIETLFNIYPPATEGDAYECCRPYLDVMKRLIVLLADDKQLPVSRDFITKALEEMRANIEHILTTQKLNREIYIRDILSRYPDVKARIFYPDAQVNTYQLLITQRQVEDQLLTSGLTKKQRQLVSKMRQLRMSVHGTLGWPDEVITAAQRDTAAQKEQANALSD